jgi:hypothetical protein
MNQPEVVLRFGSTDVFIIHSLILLFLLAAYLGGFYVASKKWPDGKSGQKPITDLFVSLPIGALAVWLLVPRIGLAGDNIASAYTLGNPNLLTSCLLCIALQMILGMSVYFAIPHMQVTLSTIATHTLTRLEDVFKAAIGIRSQIKGTQPMRILFLAANPADTSPLDLEEELRSLEAELRGVKYRDQVILTARHAVRPDDLIRYVRSDQPTVVHFSGHGSKKGIILRSDESQFIEVTGTSLQRFFSNRGVRLVVLNACYTQGQAKLLSGAVSAVVGTTDSIGDVAARRFTVAFYRALGDGYSIQEAFRDGGDAVVLDNKADVFWSDGKLDQLLINPPVD